MLYNIGILMMALDSSSFPPLVQRRRGCALIVSSRGFFDPQFQQQRQAGALLSLSCSYCALSTEYTARLYAG